jgi:hypothetical protein
MDIRGFLSVSLGSSTVQLRDSLRSRCACTCSEASFNSQNDDRASEYTAKEKCSVVRFLRAKGLDAKDIHKCFLSAVGSVCHVKLFTTKSRNMSNVSLMTKRLKRVQK